MNAVGFTHHLPISDPSSLQDVQLPDPVPTGRDLLVRVHATALNPVDTKVRAPKPGNLEHHPPKVIGWDASGVVEAVGPDVTLFQVGDEVYYAGDLNRPGSNAELQLVDERIVGRKPTTLTHAQAAALPLTAITAWEGLYDRLHLRPDGQDAGKTLLVIGGAGGVPSVAIQLARHAGLTVIATASRPESAAWVRDLGAHHVIDHTGDIPAQLRDLGIDSVHHVYCTYGTEQHWNAMVQVLRPGGSIVAIDTATDVNLNALKAKSLTFAWELMFTRPALQTDDMIEQHHLLNRVADLVDAGHVRTTLRETLRPINAANLRAAHERLETRGVIGKIVLEGWED
ncbi:zinc-binding alcohol dehydrogenase family protein [Deinococcus maricopensis]|uniref:Zinc-type alcohol dehydrogenase-like protein n=1 Tax=Deinococcus maricopensis (strain DSM 21211 / LMG 22137 / NRRL B-23946 / LB-34) TaxID=709986 RepID=E8UA02_DEIML|nr:zinc-binding alcohol dehydrogenase family protein [Deinococcus maricopensis]ADV67891.1 zinc-binding alcohol dehydrogenase family protein [Deinococcus maricopensis DSM 21211]